MNYLVPRYRPYMYEGGAPGVDPAENDLSFPSGHTTFSFASATAGVAIFLRYAPDSPLAASVRADELWPGHGHRIPARVLAGMHFVTDVSRGGGPLAAPSATSCRCCTIGWFRHGTPCGLRLNLLPQGVLLSYRY